MEFRIEIEPRPMTRPRFTNGRVYTSTDIRQYQREIQFAAKRAMAGVDILTCPLSVTIKLYRKFKPTSRRYGDFDNHAKSITDALNGIVYVDDAQIVRCIVEKYQSASPHIEVEVGEVTLK